MHLAPSPKSRSTKITIPHLELLAVLLGVRATKFTADQLKLPIQRSLLFSDSACVLYWLQTNKPLPRFIHNRLLEIRQHKDLEFWHVQTSDNPADLPTRGLDPGALAKSSLWWQGPSWLQCPEADWPNIDFSILSPDALEDLETAETAQPLYHVTTARITSSASSSALLDIA